MAFLLRKLFHWRGCLPALQNAQSFAQCLPWKMSWMFSTEIVEGLLKKWRASLGFHSPPAIDANDGEVADPQAESSASDGVGDLAQDHIAGETGAAPDSSLASSPRSIGSA